MPVTAGDRNERGRWGPPPAPPRKKSPAPPRSSSSSSSVPSSSPASVPGDPKVARMQQKLRNSGLDVDVDGVYGPQTRAAIKTYNANVSRDNADRRHATANVIKTQVTEPRAPRSLISPPPSVRSSGGSALGRYEPYQPNALGNIPGLQPHRKFKQTPDHRTPLDKAIGGVLGSIISDPLGAIELGKSATHLARHPSLRSAGGAALAGVGVIPVFRGPRAASRFAKGLDEGLSIVEAAKKGAVSFGERGPIRAAADARKIKRLMDEVQPVLDTDPIRASIHAELETAVKDGELTGEHAQRLKGQLDEAAALYADDLARKSKGGTLKQKRASNGLAYYQTLHNQAYPIERPMPSFDRSLTLKEGQKNLRQFTNQRNLGKGGVQNPTTESKLGHAVVGEITPVEHYRRTAEAVGHDSALALKLAGWYRELGPLFRTFFGDDTDAIIRGFAVSQANDSPTGGLRAVLRVRDKLLRGEEISKDEISVVVKSIEAAYKGDPVKSGLAAKLHDFADSLEGKTTRTWTGDDIRGGRPAAIDVHALRDLGRIDPKILPTLRERHGLPVAHLQLEVLNRELRRVRNAKGPLVNYGEKKIPKAQALRLQRGKVKAFKEGNVDAIAEGQRSKLKLDSDGRASGNAYNAALREYQKVTDYYNEIGAFGKHDWTPAEIQALGWSAIQRYHGVEPEDAMAALAGNTRAITFEVTRGPLGLGNDLTPAQTRLVAKSMERHIKELVEDTPGIDLRDVKVGIGGWEQGTNINISVQVLGTKDSVQSALTRFAKAFDQEWVQATREVTGKNSRATLLIDSPKFKDPRTRARFFTALNKIEPRLEGFMDYDVEGVPGLAIRTNSPTVSPKDASQFVERYRAAIEQAEAETGIKVHGSVRNIEMLTGGQHGEVAPIQTLAGSGGGFDRDALDDPLAARIRADLESEISRARGEGPAGGAGPGAAEPDGVRLRAPGPDGNAAGLDEFGNPIPSSRFASDASDALGDESLATPYETVSPLERPHPDDFAEESLATPHEPLSDLTPEEQLRQGLRSARSQYGKQKKLRHEDRRERAKAINEALRTISDPDEAMAAAADAARGELSKIDFHGLTTLNGDSLKYLKKHVNQLDSLPPFSKMKVNLALDRAVKERIVPTPSELRLIDHIFGKTTATGVVQTAGGFSEKLINALNIPRSLQSTLDLSAVARQGLVAGLSHPMLATRAVPRMLHSAGSREGYNKLMKEIESDDLYPLALAADVSFTDVSEHASIAAHEEAFASDYAARLPYLGAPIRASSRAYTAYLNKLRMDLFKERIRIALAASQDVHDEKFLESIGRVVNASTGRGTLRNRVFDISGNRTIEETILPAANILLFSPRLMLSRLNYLNPAWYMSLHPQARREALRGLFAASGSIMSALYLFSRIPGVNVGSFDKDHPFGDPRSADFGKLKIGNTRVDVAGGFQQYVKLASVLATQTQVSSTTGKHTKLGSGKFGSKDTVDVLVDFFRGKASPTAGIAMNIAARSNVIGEPTTPESIAANSFVPLILQDTKELYKERHGGVNGILWATGGYGLGAFGLGVQTYKGKESPGGFVGGDSGSSDPYSGGGSNDPYAGGGSSDPYSGAP